MKDARSDHEVAECTLESARETACVPRSAGAIGLKHGWLERLAWWISGRMDAIRSRPRVAYLAILLTLVASLFLSLRLRIDNSVERWGSEGEEPESAWFQATSRDFVTVIVSGDPRRAETLEGDRRIAARLRSLAGVAAVDSLSSTLDALHVRSLDGLGASSASFEGRLISTPHSLLALHVTLAPGESSGPIVDRIESALDAVSPDARVLGPAKLNAELDSLSREESARLFPLAVGACVVVLALVTRSLAHSIAIALVGFVPVVWLLGVAGLLGVQLDLVTINAPVLVFVIAIALAMHPYTRARSDLIGNASADFDARRRAFRLGVASSAGGCVLSALTTALGFASLLASPTVPVRTFGALAASGALLALLSHHLTFPLLARWTLVGTRESSRGVASNRGSGLASRLVDRIASYVARHRLLSRGLLLATLGGAALVASGLRVDHDPLDLLARGSPLRRSYVDLGDRIRNLAPLECEIHLDTAWSEPATLRRLATLGALVERRTGARALGPHEPVVLSAARLGLASDGSLPASDLSVRAAALAVAGAGGMPDWLVDASGRRARWIVPLPLLGGADFAAVEVAVRQAAKEVDLDLRPAGRIHRIMRVQGELLVSQARSLGLAALVTLGVLGSLCRSWRHGLAFLLVHAVPLSVLAASLVVLGVSLDTSTTMVASVALGIAVDDSAHLLCELRRSGARGVLPALRRVAPGLVVTSLVLSAGFLVLAFSAFPPIARFGGLTAAALLLSLICHVVVVPAFSRVEFADS